MGRGISDDGSTLVGWGNTSVRIGTKFYNIDQAFRWTEATGMVNLGDLPNDNPSPSSNAYAVSADGSVVVGRATAPIQGKEAFIWTEATGMIGLGDLPGGGFQSEARAVSADGSIVVGMANSGTQGKEGFVWTSGTGMVGLGRADAVGVSDDGSIIVGRKSSKAAIWVKDEDGVYVSRDLKTVLEQDHGLDLTGWTLRYARDVSGDGLVITGNGINPLGGVEGWVARLGFADTEPPLAIPPADLVVVHDIGSCYADLPNIGTPLAEDNVGVTSITNDSPGIFPVGETEVEWTIGDAAGNATTVIQLVTVTNADPIADAGQDQILECEGPAGSSYQLDGSLSYDTDPGDTELLTFQWSAIDENGNSILFDDSTSPTPTATFPRGSTTAILLVTDVCGIIGTNNVIITVDDTTAPTIEALVTDRNILQRPNHKMIQVNLEMLVRDVCEFPELLQVTCQARSNEPDDAKGDGSFTGDINGFDGFSNPVPVTLTYNGGTDKWEGSVNLRSERDGAAGGRKYSLICTVIDLAGNSSTATTCVIVPHDQRGKR
jgi:probable HAF family extracellular repeat protein